MGLSGMTPASEHCDILTMRVFLPGERIADIDLDVTSERVVITGATQ